MIIPFAPLLLIMGADYWHIEWRYGLLKRLLPCGSLFDISGFFVMSWTETDLVPEYALSVLFVLHFLFFFACPVNPCDVLQTCSISIAEYVAYL